MDAVVEILKGLDYSPLYVSLKTGIVATIFSFFLGLFCREKSDKGRTESESNCRWDPDTADGTAADGSRILPASSVQQKTSVWYPAVRTIWHQSCTDLGRLYHSSDRDRISADVQKCKSGIRTDRCESDSCGKNTWYAGI